MCLRCVVWLFFINYLICIYLRLNYLILNYLRLLTSLLTAIFIILSTWLYNYSCLERLEPYCYNICSNFQLTHLENIPIQRSGYLKTSFSNPGVLKIWHKTASFWTRSIVKSRKCEPTPTFRKASLARVFH